MSCPEAVKLSGLYLLQMKKGNTFRVDGKPVFMIHNRYPNATSRIIITKKPPINANTDLSVYLSL